MTSKNSIVIILAILASAVLMYFIVKGLGVQCTSDGHCTHMIKHEEPTLNELAIVEEIPAEHPMIPATEAGMVMPITSQDQFNRLVLENSRPVAVKIYAPRCGPCKAMAPYFKKIAQEFADSIVSVEIDSESFEGKDTLQIHGVPTIIFYKNGKEISRIVGGLSLEDLRIAFTDIRDKTAQ